jgi:hypothetical protein
MPIAKKPMSEELEQMHVVAWFKREYGVDDAEALHHSPNGGHRHKATAARIKYMGTRRGFPDLVLYLPIGGWIGCVIELKPTDSGNDTSTEQKIWLHRLEGCGFQTHGPVDGLEEAKRILSDYMNGVE